MTDQTLTDKLRSRIDHMSNYLRYCEETDALFKVDLNVLKDQQAFNKRLLGRLIQLESNLSHAYWLLSEATEESRKQLDEIARLREERSEPQVARVWQD